MLRDAPAEQFTRIHITGGPGAGKTRLARRLAQVRALPLHDLDGLLLQVDIDEAQRTASTLSEAPGWVSDGVYVAWARPFLDRAQIVVWLDVPWRVASYRMIVRHVRAELGRQNRFPGWRRFYSFWRWAARYYANSNEPTLDRLGVPGTRSTIIKELAPYQDKLVVCRTSDEIDQAFVRLTT